MSKDIKKALEHCAEWKCDNCPNGDELGSGEIVCRGRLLPQVLEYISDIEAKLAESEKKIEELNSDIYYNITCAKEFRGNYEKKVDNMFRENWQLKQQLAEKDKEIEKLQHYNDRLAQGIYHSYGEHFISKVKQDKISFAVEQLEQLRHDIWTNQADDGYTDMQVDLYDLNDTIDVRIMQIKEGK